MAFVRRLSLLLVLLTAACVLAQEPPAPPEPPSPPDPPEVAASTNKQMRFATSGPASPTPTSVSPAFECIAAVTHSNQSWHSDDEGQMRWTVNMGGNSCSVDLRAEGAI